MKILYILLLITFFSCPVSRASLEDSGDQPLDVAAQSAAPEAVRFNVNGETITELAVKDMDVREFIELMAQKSGLNIVTGQNVQGRVTLVLRNVEAREALRMALEANELASADETGIIRVMTAAEYLAKYGHAFGQEKVTRMVRLNFTTVKVALELLNQMKSDTGKVVANEETRTLVLIDASDKVRAMEAMLRQIDVQTVTAAIVFNYARAEEAAETLRASLTEGVGSLVCDTTANRVTIVDTPARVEKMKRVARELDARGRKIVLQAKLVQISLDDEHLGGVDWQGILENHQNMRLKGRYEQLAGETENRVLSLGAIAEEDFPTLLEALDTVGLVKEYPLEDMVLAGDEEARVTVQFDEPALGLTAVPAGLGLPFSAASGMNVEFLVKPSLDVDGSILTSIVPREVQSRGQARTMVAALPGATVVIGGLIATEKVATMHKIPLMGDLPLLGFAFRYRNSSVRREEFVLFLTPRLVVPKQEGMVSAPPAVGKAVTP